MDPAIITLCVLAIAAFLFITELIPLAVTAMAACTALGILGAVSYTHLTLPTTERV